VSEDLDVILQGCGAERQGVRQWTVQVPVEKRGPLAVVIGAGDHTLTLRVFLMRRPDRAHEDVYRRLLRKQFESRIWRFALDKDGDVFAVADLPLLSLSEDALDGTLGLLAALVDETYEGLVRTGFDVPANVALSPPPS
jgi:Putative bacterial sensory transduction regulator